jgi:hypothetical protein
MARPVLTSSPVVNDQQVSKAIWEGNKLIISIATSFVTNGVAYAVKRAVSLDGGDLVIEWTTPVSGGGQRLTRKVYKNS